MAINYATLEATKLWPEFLPSAEYVSPPATTEANIMNLTRLPPGFLVRLKDVGAERSASAELRLKADNEVFATPAVAIPDLTGPTQYDLIASRLARLAVYGVPGVPLANYKVWHGLWAWKQTIADKLALGITLTSEEKAINEELGIYKTVERGTLPIKLDRTLLYEYWPLYQETRSITKNVPVTGIEVETIRPRKLNDQFVALEKVSCDTPAVADNVRFTICRDNDGSAASPYLTLNTWVMSLEFDIPMFIPALREIRTRVECDVPQVGYTLRYTYTIYKMTNILRMRWGLIAKERNPDLWKRVAGGIV